MIDDEKRMSMNRRLSIDAHLMSLERRARRQALAIGLVALVAVVVIGLLHPAAAPILVAGAPLESVMLLGE